MDQAKVAEIITIGNEILDGRVTDTNRVYLGRQMKNLGFEVRYAQSVDDDHARIVDAFRLASTRSDVVFCTGGLGPTTDDMTAEAFAKFLGRPYRMDPDAEAFVRKILASRNREPNPSQLKQAFLAEGCRVLFNPLGTAPGFAHSGEFSGRAVSFYFFPGVPAELRAIFEKEILPKLESAPFRSHTWSTIFTAEGTLQEQIKEVEKRLPPFKIGFRTQFPENFVSLMGNLHSDADEKKWMAAINELDPILSPVSYAKGAPSSFEERIFRDLEKIQGRLLLVESCTGGLVANLLTDVAGVSKVLWGSQVCYANEEKFRLGVDPKIVEAVGAVSEECARAMAEAGLRRLCEDSIKETRFLFSLSTTGIAGPGGGSERKPVGLCYVGLACKDLKNGTMETSCDRIFASKFYDRRAMKLYMAKKALDFLRVKTLSFISD